MRGNGLILIAMTLALLAGGCSKPKEPPAQKLVGNWRSATYEEGVNSTAKYYTLTWEKSLQLMHKTLCFGRRLVKVTHDGQEVRAQDTGIKDLPEAGGTVWEEPLEYEVLEESDNAVVLKVHLPENKSRNINVLLGQDQISIDNTRFNRVK